MIFTGGPQLWYTLPNYCKHGLLLIAQQGTDFKDV